MPPKPGGLHAKWVWLSILKDWLQAVEMSEEGKNNHVQNRKK